MRHSKSSSHIHVGYCGARSVSTVVTSSESSVVVMMTTAVEDEDDVVHK